MGARSSVRSGVIRTSRPSVVVRASVRKESVAAAVVVAAGAVLSTPLVAEAGITPSLSNFLGSIVAGGVVLGGIALAITLVSGFDRVNRDDWSLSALVLQFWRLDGDVNIVPGLGYRVIS
jgi:hypothetical protein